MMDGIKLKDNERIDDLQINGLKLIQSTDGFCFGCDAVELANFVSGFTKNDTACDLGAGNGIISVLLAGKKGLRITAVEIQKEVAELCVKNAALNNLSDRMEVINKPMQEFCTSQNKGSFDIVVTNPPYLEVNRGEVSKSGQEQIARHEIAVTLSEVIETAAHLLKFKGKFFMVYQTNRLADALAECKKNLIEPKILQILTPNNTKEPHLFLLSGIKNGNSGLRILKERVIDAFNV